MSQLAVLMDELCPDGVEFKSIAQLFELRNGYTPPRSNPEYWEGGTVPWFRMDDIRANGRVLDDSFAKITLEATKGGRLFKPNSLLVATSATIGEHALITVPHLSNQRFTSLTLKTEYEEVLDMKFVFYFGFVLDAWCARNTTTSSFASVDMVGFRKFSFPIPPMDVQRQIVEILDQFSELAAGLNAELGAEIQARQRQYEYYRDSLLDFADRSKTTWTNLGSVVEIRDSMRRPITRSARKPGPIPYFGANGVQDYVNDHLFDGVHLLVGEDGSVLRKNGTPVVNWAVGKIWVNNHAHVLGELPGGAKLRFLYHYLQTVNIGSMVDATRPKLTQAMLRAIPVPVVDADEQVHLTEILDRFDVLVTELTSRLPTEIAARRKQYEHYRDSLLTFKEAA